MRWLKAFISKFPPYRQETGNPTGNKQETKRGFSVKLETAIVSTPYALMRNLSTLPKLAGGHHGPIRSKKP